MTPDALEQSIMLLEQALAIDPDYAAAWDGLASGYMNQADSALRPIDESFTLARKAASQALALATSPESRRITIETMWQLCGTTNGRSP